MLKLVSVVMIAAGSIFALASAVMLIGAASLGAVGAAAGGEAALLVDGDELSGTAVLAVIALVCSACHIAAGVNGLAAPRTGRTVACMRLGAAVIVLTAISNVLACRAVGSLSIPTMIASLIMPSIYMISVRSLSKHLRRPRSRS